MKKEKINTAYVNNDALDLAKESLNELNGSQKEVNKNVDKAPAKEEKTMLHLAIKKTELESMKKFCANKEISMNAFTLSATQFIQMLVENGKAEITSRGQIFIK